MDILISWCAKEKDDQPQGQGPKSPAFNLTTSVGLFVRTNDQDASVTKECHQFPMPNSHTTSSCQSTKARKKNMFLPQRRGTFHQTMFQEAFGPHGEED